jgi:hypothetical protein
VIPAARISARERLFARERAREPTAEERAVLVEQAVDEEVLYREALARALDRDDRSIRGHLAEKMRFLEPASNEDASDNRPSRVAPSRSAWTGATRSSGACSSRRCACSRSARARRTRRRRDAGGLHGRGPGSLAPARAGDRPARLPPRRRPRHARAPCSRAPHGRVDFASAGDPFHTGHVVSDAARPALVNLFGETIADYALAAPARRVDRPAALAVGRPPRPRRRAPAAALPAVADVRSQLVLAWREERREARERAALAQLRQQWRSAWRTRGMRRPRGTPRCSRPRRGGRRTSAGASLLELREGAGGAVDVTWTTPGRRVPGVSPRVVLPEGCRSTSRARARTPRGSASSPAGPPLCGPDGLVGRRVGVTELAEARSEVLVRIAYANGRSVQASSAPTPRDGPFPASRAGSTW